MNIAHFDRFIAEMPRQRLSPHHKALEDRASQDGKLDAVVLLKAKRVAFEQGKWTMGFGVNLPKVSPEARDARRSLDADFACLRIST